MSPTERIFPSQTGRVLRPPVPPVAPTRSRRSQLDRSSLGTAAGTLVSRLTGLARLVVVAYALGGQHLGDAFNLANNTPNMIHDLVLGGVLAATFVPVFVDRLTTRSAAEAEESIAAVISLSFVILVVATVVFELLAPAVIDLYTFGASTAPGERALAVDLLRYFIPQLLCYGAISLWSAVLATRDRFGAVGFAPVWNNVLSIIVLGIFAAVAAGHVSIVEVSRHRGLVALLGIGTTAAVAAQALALVPSMRRAGVRLRFLWRPRDPAIRLIASLSGWTLGFVAANQLAVFVILAMEVHLGAGGVSAYTYAFTFFQLPFGVVAVSIVNVITPDLARSFSRGRLDELGQRFGVGTRQILALVLPATVGYLLLAQPIVSLLIGHGAETPHDAHLTSSTLVMFALGLPSFCVYFLVIRAFQAMQDTRTAFVLYVLENATNILAAVLLYRPLGVRGLALGYSIAYTVAALVALAVLRERLGTIGGRAMLASCVRSLALSLVMAFVVALVAAVLGTGNNVIGFFGLVASVAAGALVYVGGAGLAGTVGAWQTARRQQPPPADSEPEGRGGVGGGRARHSRRH